MKKKIFLSIVIVAVLTVFVLAVWGVLRVNGNSRLYKLIEQNNTNEAVKLISQMSEEDVNEYSLPLFLNRTISILSQGMWTVELPLVKACEYGNYEIIEALLKKGADPNKFVEGGWSPIEVVFVRHHGNRLEIAKLLIEYGADVNLCGSGSPALFSEAVGILPDAENEELSNTVITLLIDNGANTVESNGSYSVLHYSARENSVLISENLINNYHLPVDAINENGQTPLMMSAKNNAVDTAKLLLEHGADKSMKDRHGKTAYDYAAEAGNEELAVLLKP